MEERYYDYFAAKLEKLPELRQHTSSLDNPAFEKWWGSIIATCERMGATYKKRAEKIHFFPQILGSGDDSVHISKRYQSGLNQAEAFLENLMEELQTWGLHDDNAKRPPDTSTTQENPFNLYLTISQHQAQQIIQTINLDDYDAETKQKVNELFKELNKTDKNKAKIKEVVNWLADKSVDALIAILLAKASLT